MDRQHILSEIKRTAAANGGKPLGQRRFAEATGIRTADWFGKYWARWGDALVEAGFSPNELQGPYGVEVLLEKLVPVIRELGRFPVKGDLKLIKSRDKSFPNDKTFERLGPKSQLVEKVKQYCHDHAGHEDVLEICNAVSSGPSTSQATEPVVEIVGFVYLMRHGRHFKIGKTNATGRREYELAIQLPEKLQTIHTIKTDDPDGIEAYWHKRFAAKRGNGEWFELDTTDIAAFKRRKFM